MSEPLASAVSTTAEGPIDILMFGTGRFLRGFACDIIERSAGAGPLEWRVHMVQSTGRARADRINAAGGRFGLAVRGLEAGATRDDVREIGVVSRCLVTDEDWDELRSIAASAGTALILSNVTSAGLEEAEEAADVHTTPATFIGRLTALLFERYRALGDGPEADIAVLPCELVERNGNVVRDGVRTQAARWSLDGGFTAWLERRTCFLNNLVDRIVTEPSDHDRGELERRLGRADPLLTVAEPYALWAIERPIDRPGSERHARIAGRGLAWAGQAAEVKLVDDIDLVATRKLRLLNGAHTVCAALAVLTGVETVQAFVEGERTGGFLRAGLFGEILPTMQAARGDPEDDSFACAVLERFANPFLAHKWADIAQQSAAKAETRLMPTIREAIGQGRPTPVIAAGLAGILALHRDGNGVMDHRAEAIRTAWERGESDTGVVEAAIEERVFGDVSEWGEAERDELVRRVAGALGIIQQHGVEGLLERGQSPD